jgi:flavin reductase (DIM6/NTAB) family NADH-FMN oxidoreductase RutF
MKRNLGPSNALYPSLTTIIGTWWTAGEFLAVGPCGHHEHGQPQYLSFGINTAHYSGRGIHKHREFSVCIPSEDMVRETDYVGACEREKHRQIQLVRAVCGELAHAPLIRRLPCVHGVRLDRVLDFGKHEVFVGEIVATHVDEDVLRQDGKIDIARVRPLLFDFSSVTYWGPRRRGGGMLERRKNAQGTASVGSQLGAA